MRRANARCCLEGNFTIDKFVCVVQRDLEEYVVKDKDKKKGKNKKSKEDCSGRSLLEIMWEELDAVFERLISNNPAEDGRDPGRAEGIAYCIAVVQSPYAPSIDAVREQAMQRWQEHNEGEETEGEPQ